MWNIEERDWHIAVKNRLSENLAGLSKIETGCNITVIGD